MSMNTPPLSRNVSLFMLIGGIVVIIAGTVGMFFGPSWILGAMIGLGVYLVIRGVIGLRTPPAGPAAS